MSGQIWNVQVAKTKSCVVTVGGLYKKTVESSEAKKIDVLHSIAVY